VGGDADTGKKLMEHTPFTWFGLQPFPQTVMTSGLVAVLLVLFAASVHRRLAATDAAIDPGDGVNGRSIAEVFVEAMTSLTEGVVGHGAERYVPLLASFFIFILIANLIGLVPGFVPPTADFNITFGLGAVSFFAYHFYGIREHGVKYVKQFLGSVVFLYPLMFIVEIFSHLFRPVSLGIRLFANLFADHQVVEIFTDLTKLVVPVIFYVLGAFVSIVQAFVFTMLSAIYIALAVSHDH
jgi:F-type H+-transporting ATPase subunit a